MHGAGVRHWHGAAGIENGTELVKARIRPAHNAFFGFFLGRYRSRFRPATVQNAGKKALTADGTSGDPDLHGVLKRVNFTN